MFTSPKKEISDLGDIHLLVDTFYKRAGQDDLLAPLFAYRLSANTNALEPVYRYWQSILLEEEADMEIPFLKPADLPLTHQHFDRWLSLFHRTVDELFTGTLADRAKFRAIRMSEVFRYKMQLTNF